ncbi:hypothetical protein D9V29_10210 [Mycetocola manganoxydans]|uniref:Tyr recombinase domain-containing protein n=3 Tax=Mycetocola manganoxydans TaxID=699879 RepID=A0A3L6ZRB1_9MICO|nr:hypothetical protein D9V29_10210 [Mycetocola manganoxydans]
MNINYDTALDPATRARFRSAALGREKWFSESFFQTDDGHQVGPGLAGGNATQHLMMDTAQPADLAVAATAHRFHDVPRKKASSLRHRVVASDIRPRDTQLRWGRTAGTRGHGSSLVSLVGRFDGPMSEADGALVVDTYRHCTEESLAQMENYKPRMKNKYWREVGPFVRDSVAVAAPSTAYTAHRLLTPVATYTLWAWRDAGLPLEADVLFQRETIEHFIRSASGTLSEGTLRNYRSMLLRVSDVLVPECSPLAMKPLNDRASIAPYSEKELARLRNWAMGQSTETRRRKAAMMLSLCGGAGLKAVEVAELRREHVSIDADGILVQVESGNVRVIPLLAEWESWLVRGLGDTAAGHLVFGAPTRKHSRNVLSAFVDKADGVEHPRSDRLRATWILTHLTAGTPMKGLMKAAGVSKFENLSRYLQYIPELDTADYRRRLRIEATR